MSADTPMANELRQLMTGTGWQHPFFLAPLTQATIIEDASVKTLCIDGFTGELRFNPDFVKSLSPAQKVFAMCHELMHPLSQHHERRGERQHGAWNIAADMTINHFLKAVGLTPLEGIYFPEKGWEDLCAEEIYERIRKDPNWSKTADAANQSSPGSGQVGKGCGASNSGQQPGQQQSGEGIDWQRVAAQARAQAAGTKAGDIMGRLLTPRPSGMRWRAFIRGVVNSAVAQHGRDEQTWRRHSRRSPPGIILPGYKSTRARVAIAIDVSGSMSDEQISRAVDNVNEIARLGESRIFLAIHDAELQYGGWLDGTSRPAIQKTIKGRGGTDFQPAYDSIRAVRANFDVMVHLTDGYNFRAWPERPHNCRKLIAAIMVPLSSPGLTPRPLGTIDVEVQV